MATIAIDLAIDGLLVGIGVSLGEGQGRIITFALTLEVLFLGLSLAAELAQRGLSTSRALFLIAGVSGSPAVGAIGGAAVLDGASHALLAGVLAAAHRHVLRRVPRPVRPRGFRVSVRPPMDQPAPG